MKLYLKRASYNDCDILFEWANDSLVRKNSFNKANIEYKDHIEWFKRKLNSYNSYIFILYLQDIAVGQVRLDIEKNCGEIDYSIDKSFRKRGLGSVIIYLLENEIMGVQNLDILKANVLRTNISSQKVFEKNNYIKNITEEFYVYYKYIK